MSHRKHPTHGILVVDHQPTIIFDTVCTKDRKKWLACDEVHQLLQETWKDADAWLMGRYVVMPDHIHFFAGAVDPSVPYENWVKYWKSQFSKKHHNKQHRWLVDHWDRRVRSEDKYEEKWEYVRRNPVRHELVKTPEEWPYQGEVNALRWN